MLSHIWIGIRCFLVIGRKVIHGFCKQSSKKYSNRLSMLKVRVIRTHIYVFEKKIKVKYFLNFVYYKKKNTVLPSLVIVVTLSYP